MYWSYRWYHKTKQEKLTWSWLSNVFNTPCLHSVEDWYHASNWPWNQNVPHTGDKIHSTTYREDRQVFWIVVWIPFGECWLDHSELTTDVITNKTIGFWFLWQTWNKIPLNLWNDKADVQCSRIIFRESLNGQKTFSFGHCPNHLTPPLDPNSGNLVLFFGRQNSRFESHLRGGEGDILTT